MPDFEQIKSEIEKLIGRNQVEKALELLMENVSAEQKSEVILLQGRFSRLASKSRMGILSTSEANIAQNRITYAILELKNDIDEGEELPKRPPSSAVSTSSGGSRGGDRGLASRKKYPKEESNIIKHPMEKGAREFIDFEKIEGEIKILYLAATPKDAGQINTGKESRFKDLIRKFDDENKFEVVGEHGLTVGQFQNHIIDEDPHIVHYGGHGEYEGIVLEDKVLEGDVLAGILDISENVQCVVLNACYSLPIAKEVAKYIPYVVGTQDAIDDEAAIAFARGFYVGIVAGKSVEKSFKAGVLMVRGAGLPDADVLILVKGEK